MELRLRLAEHAMRSMFASEGWTLSGQLDGLDEHDPELIYYIDATRPYGPVRRAKQAR